MISQMRANLQYTGDIVRELEPAPGSKREIRKREREIAGAAAMFMSPMIEGLAPQLLHLFTRNMTTGIPELPAEVEEEVEPGEYVGSFQICLNCLFS